MAKILVIGGTGFAGSSIARNAASRGHEVTSLSRSAPTEPIDGVKYELGSAANAADVATNADVIVSALSPRKGSEGTMVATYTALAELAIANDLRLITIGGFGSMRPAPGAPRFAEGDDMPPEVLPEAREMLAVLQALETFAPELDWVFVSPAMEFGSYLPQGEPRGTYRVSTDVAIFDAAGKSAITGADLALAIVDEIERATHHRTQLHFAY